MLHIMSTDKNSFVSNDESNDAFSICHLDSDLCSFLLRSLHYEHKIHKKKTRLYGLLRLLKTTHEKPIFLLSKWHLLEHHVQISGYFNNQW